MEKKIIFSALGCLIFGFITAISFYSCSPRTMAINHYYPYTVRVPYAVHDTIRPKPLTEAEKQVILKKFYDNLLGPRFDKMELVITTQANSIISLTQTLKEMRLRSIHNRDSMQNEENSKDSINDKLRHDLLIQQTATAKAERQQVMQNLEQIKKLNSIVNFLLWGFASLWAVILLGYTIIYAYINGLKRDTKRSNYV